MNELKQCPFCGSEPGDVHGPKFTNGQLQNGKTVYWVECGCSVMLCESLEARQAWFRPEEAVKEWNTRPAESAFQKRVEELEKKVKRVEALGDNWQQRMKVAQCNSRPDCIDWSRWKMCEQELKDALNGGGS